jgi:hypothetical protein
MYRYRTVEMKRGFGVGCDALALLACFRTFKKNKQGKEREEIIQILVQCATFWRFHTHNSM